ncbi:hypothetical protein [Cellulomonas soli]|uniref:Luciferase-like domain-containing protein n=1 Tax=Cellulomonas soli TaxID=931535 RepID=A0A512P8C3_9CELL|nr:hypothetical protein [Cellulomonas soli]NYI57666.1 alkanesulfonate monooxygenase SsuD/methylene tetrahydromethanopterin reductase-like flavin-dependent oxidoreductase (luciferase family) [Cellulomonas soli]GEP67444.1 hypothetical protein CSO01_01590 [Cellulomonas soli]
MSTLTLDRARSSLALDALGVVDGVDRTTEPGTARTDVVVFHPRSATAVTLAAARADVVRLEFSSAWPDVPALRGAVAMLREELDALGRPRAEVRVELAVEVVVVADARAAATTRTRFEMLDALAGVAPHVTRGSLVGTSDELRTQVQALARRVGADTVVTVPLATA